MPGVITHMVIAREIMKRLPPGTIQEEGLFYLGNLAPDAIHAREDYIREWKKHTHFRDGIPDQEFELKENFAQYRSRLAEFIRNNKDRQDGLFDLYLGYVSHILSDELFMLTVRKEFCEVMEGLGIPQNDIRFFEYIVTDMNRNDFLLVQSYEGMEEIRARLEQVGIQPIEEFLSAKEMKVCRDWLVKRHYIEENEFLKPVYISYQRTLDYIQAAAAYILPLITEEGPLRMI